MNSLKELQGIYDVVDNAFAKVQKQFSDEVRCGKGCDDCCHAVFDVSIIEAVALLKHFQTLSEEDHEAIIEASSIAFEAWEKLVNQKGEFSEARIRCPLLNEEGLCSCYEFRPVNCRTYGIPTVINGAGHVCGFSGFEPGRQYPTVSLEQIQQALYNLSVGLAGEKTGIKRMPIAAVLLREEEFSEFFQK